MTKKLRKILGRLPLFGLGLLGGITLWRLWRGRNEEKEQYVPEARRQVISMPPMPQDKIGPVGQASPLEAARGATPGVPVVGEEMEAGPRLEESFTLVDPNNSSKPVLANSEGPVLDSLLDIVETETPSQAVYSVESQVPPPPRRDNFTAIEGIGPVINELLHAAGIDTFTELAETGLDRLTQILSDARLPMVNPGTWPEQARLAAVENWEDLEAFQNELLGGRRRT